MNHILEQEWNNHYESHSIIYPFMLEFFINSSYIKKENGCPKDPRTITVRTQIVLKTLLKTT